MLHLEVVCVKSEPHLGVNLEDVLEEVVVEPAFKVHQLCCFREKVCYDLLSVSFLSI